MAAAPERDLLYILAVAEGRIGNLNQSRKHILEAKAIAGGKSFQQGDSLLSAVEAALLQEGLIGGALVMGVVGIVGAIAAIAATATRRR